MQSYAATLEVTHDCPYCHLTRRFPDASIVLWCNMRSHVIEIDAESDETIEALEHYFIGDSTTAQTYRQGSKVSIVTRDCNCEEEKSSVCDMIEDSGCWYVPPPTFKGGWEYYRIVSWEKENLTKLVKAIEASGGKVQLKSFAPLGDHGSWHEHLIPSDSLLAGLTNKQIRALVEAYQLGYFETPARTDADSMARRFGTSRSTFAEHLRKAEWKVIANMYPVLKMVARDSERGRPRTVPSE